MANIVCRGKLPHTPFFQSEGDVFGVVVAISGQHIKNHSSEHLLGLPII